MTDTPPVETYTLSLHDALPISSTRLPQHESQRVAQAIRWRTTGLAPRCAPPLGGSPGASPGPVAGSRDRKSTRLNSSHVAISYAVFCLKKKRKQHHTKRASQEV